MKKRRLLILIAVAVFLVYTIKHMQQEEQFTLSDEQKQQFIEVVDQVSLQKIQIDWREVAALYAATHNGSYAGATNDRIQELASMFIGTNQKGYRLKTIEEIIAGLGINASQEELLERYLSDLKEESIPAGKEKNYAFIHQLREAAIENFKEYGILPSITISQAILESNWGNSQLSRQYNNLFGIKEHSKWQGATASLNTTEHNGQKTSARFRVYNSIDDSIRDHAQFLKRNPRYEKNGFFQAKTYREQAIALEKAGYSTAENENGERIYSQLLMQLIKQYNLQVIDHEAYKQMG